MLLLPGRIFTKKVQFIFVCIAVFSWFGLVRARASRNVFFHRLILEIEGEASGFDFSAASTPFQDFSSLPPRAALPRSSSARRIFKDTRAVPLPSVPRVVVRLGGSRQAAQTPRKPPFCRFWPSILISKPKPIVSSDTQGAPYNPIHRPPRRDESKTGLGSPWVPREGVASDVRIWLSCFLLGLGVCS